MVFSEVFHQKGGFDVVIANPPYLGVKGHSDIFKPIKKGKLGKFYSGRGELFYFFFHLSLNIGRNYSTIAFITTNYYPNATYGGLLRKDFKDRAKIVSLINFNELRIFESALGQHNMITILKKSNDDGILAQNLITKNEGIANSNVLLNILYGKDHETSYYTVAQSDIYEGDEHYIRLSGTSGEKNKINRILNKISNNPLIGDICFVRQGLRTGIDKTTKSHRNNYGFDGDIGVGVFVVSEKELSNMNLNISEKHIPKKFYKNSNIAQYYTTKTTEYYVLYLNKTYNERNLKMEFPNIYAHLYKFKDLIIRIRNRNNERLENWTNLDRPREQIIFTSNKIVAPQRSYVNTFGYNEGDWYTSADVYYIIQNNKEYSLKYVLSLLNSKLYYLWLYKRGKRKGEMLELYQRPLSEIPIKKISIEEQEQFVSLVDKILSLIQSDDYLESPQKQAKVKTLEREIDRMVYKLYELTEEELQIVEGAAK